jgi:phi13 family phage major tail protein
MPNKIKYGLKNVYYAVATIAADGSATYETPVAFPGALSLSMEPQGENSPFYADNIVYWVGTSNTGYEGDLELALVIDAFKKDVLGYQEDKKNVLVEDANANAVHFALLFQFEGDVKATRHVLYNCTATRPKASGSTKEESVEPETESVTVTATTVYNASYDSDIVKADTTEATDATTYSDWFTQVYIPEKTP